MKQRIEFEVISGPLDGHVFLFTVKKVSLGRGPDNQISLPDDSRIRKQSHVVFKAGKNGNWHLKNNAKRSVMVDGDKTIGETTITSGQTIKVGNTVLFVNEAISSSGGNENEEQSGVEEGTAP
ncbi:MAG: FHA domain-containing protein [Actinobacteria bacterium]|nr:FHA domain-containing protein [Actinomycetota bacterium]